MKHRTLMPLALIATVVALAGCGSSNKLGGPEAGSNSTAAEEALVTSAIAGEPAMVEENVYESNDPTALDTQTAALEAINPLHFWRTIRSVERRLDFVFTNPDTNGRPQTAVVTVHKRLRGSFNIIAGDPTEPDSAHSLIRKPLDDRWIRRLALFRVRINEDSTRSRWRLVGTSGVKVTSDGATTQILSLRLQAGPLDTTITDPLELHRLRRLIRLDPSTPVRLTVTTTRADDIVLLYRWDHRRRFVNNGDNTYTAEFTTGDFPGLRHFGVNALSHGTLFDDTAPYDSQAWILPFVVRGDGDVLALN